MKKIFMLIISLIFLGCTSANNSPKPSEVRDVRPIQDDFSDLAKERICNNLGKDACFNLAQKYYKNRDYRRAIYTYDKICANFHYLPACTRMGFMFEKGLGVKQNLVVAYDIYKRACYSGDNPSCDSMKRVER